MRMHRASARNKVAAFRILVLAVSAVATMDATWVGAAQAADVPKTQAIERELIPGADKMSAAEREAYRQRMQAAITPEEKAKIRAGYAKSADERASSTRLVGDPVKGASLHRACFYCHGIERYVAPVTSAASTFMDSVLRASGLSDLPPTEPTRFKGRVKSLTELREGVNRRNDYLSPKMTAQEIEDVVAYLNVTYYKFPQ